ncbi:MAG: hypothetical protein ACYDEB_02760 [Dehalococcoidia bacterium]
MARWWIPAAGVAALVLAIGVAALVWARGGSAAPFAAGDTTPRDCFYRITLGAPRMANGASRAATAPPPVR